MPLLEAVLVDFDGTLVDSELANARAYTSALEEFGFLKEASEIIGVIAGRHWSQFLPIIMGEHYSVEIGKNISELKREIYPTFYDEITLNLPLLSLLETLKKTIPIAIVSNSTRESILKILNFLDIEHIFDQIISADDVSRPKPEPDMYEYALKQMGVSASGSLAFEDSATGFLAAKAAGIPCINFSSYNF
jgi:HAD superfamily hydrolase (TIGR01509 family)